MTKCPEGIVLDKVIENSRNHYVGWGRGKGSGKATWMKLPLSRATSEVKRKENREDKGADARGTLVYLRKECSACRVVDGRGGRRWGLACRSWVPSYLP